MKKIGWVNCGKKDFPSYHFYAPENWTLEQRKNETRINFEIINSLSDFGSRNIVPGWLALVERLPIDLYNVLVCELREDNELTDICA